MSTATEERTKDGAGVEKFNAGESIPKWALQSVTYKPLGSDEELTLNGDMVLNWLVNKTKNGHEPSKQDVAKFIRLCAANKLNPWVGDAYFLGYDTNDGPQWNLITSIQALLKRAEANKDFDGIQAGVCLLGKDMEIIERKGSLIVEEENLVGGWAIVKRKNTNDAFYESLSFKVYNTGKSRWGKDPAGMIVKCARAAVLRMAFPSMAGCYLAEEFDKITDFDEHLADRAAERQAQQQVNTITRANAPKTVEDIVAARKQRAAITHTEPAPSIIQAVKESAPVEVAKASQKEVVAESKATAQPNAANSGDLLDQYLGQVRRAKTIESLESIGFDFDSDQQVSEEDRAVFNEAYKSASRRIQG